MFVRFDAASWQYCALGQYTSSASRTTQILLSFVLLLLLVPVCHGFGATLARPWEIEANRGFTSSSSRSRASARRRHPNRCFQDADVLLLVLRASSLSDSTEPVLNNCIDGGHIGFEARIEATTEEASAPESSLRPNHVLTKKQNPSDGYLEHLSTRQVEATVWKSRGALFQMTRPNNIPGVVLFHMLGIYLVSTAMGLSDKFWSILLKEPAMWLTLLSTNLVSATSMVVNDYYDAKLGRDVYKEHETKVLLQANGPVTNEVARRFLMYLYASALFTSNCLPGIPTRLSVTVGLMLTYLYTVHLKPMTWVKNIVCASLIALAPWTSGSCALYLLQSGGGHVGSIGVWFVPSLWRLFGVLFCGVVGREILMDCNDLLADGASGLRTVPVVHGRLYASRVAAASTVVMTLLAVVPHLQQLTRLPAAVALWSSAPLRRLLLAATGCGLQLRGTWRAVQTEGADATVIEAVVGQSLLTVVLMLASFV